MRSVNRRAVCVNIVILHPFDSIVAIDLVQGAAKSRFMSLAQLFYLFSARFLTDCRLVRSINKAFVHVKFGRETP